MSKRIIAGITLFSFLSLGTPVLAGPSGVFVESSEGSVTLRGDTADWNSAKSKGLTTGDSVVLGPEAQVTLLFPNGSRVRVAPNSEFRLQPGEDGQASLYLLRGRVISSVRSSLVIETYRSNAVATEGDFVLETSSTDTGLKVLSGNAHLKPNRGQEMQYDLLTSAPTLNENVAKRAVLAFGKLASEQTVQDDEAVYGAQGKGKGAGVRKEREKEKTGGVGRVAPDQDMLPPGKNPAAAAVPPAETPPPVATTPSTAPITTPPSGIPPAVVGAASPWPWILGGLGTALGLAALLSGDDDDDVVVFGGGGGGNVPSPSLP